MAGFDRNASLSHQGSVGRVLSEQRHLHGCLDGLGESGWPACRLPTILRDYSETLPPGLFRGETTEIRGPMFPNQIATSGDMLAWALSEKIEGSNPLPRASPARRRGDKRCRCRSYFRVVLRRIEVNHVRADIASSRSVGSSRPCTPESVRVSPAVRRVTTTYGNRGDEILQYAIDQEIDLMIVRSPALTPEDPRRGLASLSWKLGMLAGCDVLLVK